MKILLIRNDEPGLSTETNITGIYPPLGLAYIASVLRNAGYKVSILDNQISRLQNNQLKNEIKNISPDIVLLSAMTSSWHGSVWLSRLIKEASSRITIGAGGPHLTAYPKEALSHKSLDFVICGEGENTILEVLKKMQEGKTLEGVKGCVFRQDEDIIVNPPREEIDDLDSVLFPSIDLLPYKEYIALSVRNPFFTMVTSRGCPYRCKFCFQGYLGRYRARSAENVVKEMEMLIKEYGIREIVTFDETFAAEEERAVEICRLIQEKGLKFKWDIRTRIDLIDEKVLRSLKSAGCYRIHLGIESGSQEILSSMDKKISVREIVDKIKLAKKFGFELRGYFMLAYPGETRKDICRTIEFARSLPLDWASFTITIGLPGTEIYKEALGSGRFSVDYWREDTKGNAMGAKPYFIPGDMDENDLFEMKKRAYLEFYLRPRVALNVLKNLRFIKTIRNFQVFLRLVPSICHSITGI